MTVSFIWDEIYSVGNAIIDGHHKQMFELANSLPDNINDKALKKTIVSLYNYILKHFDAEEALMKEKGYDRIEEHRAQHNALISNLNAITAKPFRNDEDLLKFKKFVYNWIIEHIMHQDKIFFDHVKNLDMLELSGV